MIFRNIKVRLYPTIQQKKMLDNHFDAYRYCYNLCLEYKSFLWKHYKISNTGIDMQTELFEILKSTEWLSSCKVECIREAAHDVENAFRFFFKGKGYPNYKSKKGEQSFATHQNIKSTRGKIKFFKNLIKYKDSDKYVELLQTNGIKKITFKKDCAGNYWATCLIEIEKPEQLPEINSSIGIDLGIKYLAVTSQGVIYPNNKYVINSEFKLKKLQRKFSKTKKGGSNREKLRIKIAKIYRKSVRKREHYYHQVTNELIRENQTIIIETLNINGMIQNHKLARSISDASWGLIISQLQYKAAWYGREIIKVDRFYASSKTCSNCGNKKDLLSMKERVYICDSCGMSLNRDHNAAINIRNAGLKIPSVPVEGVGYEPNEAGSKSLILTI